MNIYESRIMSHYYFGFIIIIFWVHICSCCSSQIRKTFQTKDPDRTIEIQRIDNLHDKSLILLICKSENKRNSDYIELVQRHENNIENVINNSTENQLQKFVEKGIKAKFFCRITSSSKRSTISAVLTVEGYTTTEKSSITTLDYNAIGFTKSTISDPCKNTEKSMLLDNNAGDESVGNAASIMEYISSPFILSGTVILTVTIVILIMVIVLCMKKKIKRKAEEETYASVVQYVELDLTSSETPRPETNNDPPYAKIIGTIAKK